MRNLLRLTSRIAALLVLFAVCLSPSASVLAAARDEAAPRDAAAPMADELISLPLRELGIVIDKEKRGVIMPYDELLKLWELARQKAGELEAEPPATCVVRSARLEGRLVGEVLALRAAFEVELLVDDWVQVDLGLMGLTITRALDGDAPLALRDASAFAESKRGPQPQRTADLRGKGVHTLTIEGLVPLDAHGTRFAFTIPRAAVSLVELTLPAGRKLELADALLTDTTDAGEGLTRHAFLLGSTTRLVGTLSALDETPKASGETPKAPGMVFVRTDSVVRFDATTMQTTTQVAVTVRHKALDSLHVRVPAEVKVASVAGEAVASWEARPDGDEQLVTVQLAQRATDRAALVLTMQSLYDRGDTSLEVPIPVVEEATDARGFIGVGNAPMAKVYVASTDGLVEASSAELATTDASVFAVYRYHGTPGRLTLGLEWPVRRLRVAGTTLLDIQRHMLRLDAVFVVTPVEGDLFDLALDVPPGYEITDVLAVTGESLANSNEPAPEVPAAATTKTWDVEEMADGARVLHVRLSHKVGPGGRLVLVINARMMPPPALISGDRSARVTEALPAFTVRDAERQTGVIGIAGDPSYEIEDEAVAGLEPASIDELNAAGVAGAGLRFGYSFREPGFAAELVITKRRPLVHAATATTVAVHGDVIDVLALSEFSIWYSELREILLRVPSSVDPANVEITGDDIRDRRLLTAEEKAALGETGTQHVWRITLDAGKSDVYVLSVAYQVKVTGGEAAHTIPLLDYAPMDEVEVDRGYVAVIANREIELATELGDPRLREMDKADLPRQLFPSTPLARVLFAYEYPRPPQAERALGLVVERHEPAKVLAALVEDATIVVTVSHRNGAFGRAEYRVRNNEEVALRLRLPDDSRLWSVEVNGARIKPREQTDKAGRLYVVPIGAATAPNQAQIVVVRYWWPMPQLGRRGSYTVKVPRFDNLHVGKAMLWVLQPDEYHFVRTSGNMTLKAEVKQPPLLVRWARSSNTWLREHPRRRALIQGMSEEETGDGRMGYMPTEKAEAGRLRTGTSTLEKPAAEPRNVVAGKLDTMIPEVDFKDAQFEEVIGFLARETGVNIVVDPAAEQTLRTQGRAGMTTIKLTDVPLKEVLKYVLRYHNLKYVVEDYALLIVPIDYALHEEMQTQMFYLSAGGAATYSDLKGAEGPEAILDWLRNAEGITWPEGSAIAYNASEGRLAITNTPSNMAQLESIAQVWDKAKDSAIQSVDSIPVVDSTNRAYRESDRDDLGEVGGWVQWLPGSGMSQVTAGDLLDRLGPSSFAGTPGYDLVFAGYADRDAHVLAGTYGDSRSWWQAGAAMQRGLVSMALEVPVEGIDVEFGRLSGGGEVRVQYASGNSMGRTQAIVIVLTILLGYGLRRLLGWSRTALVLFAAAVCTIAPGLSNYWATPFWDMVMKGVLLLAAVFVVEYVVQRVKRRRLAAAAAAVLLVALVVPGAWAAEPTSARTAPTSTSVVLEDGGKRIYIPFKEVEQAFLGGESRVFIGLDEFLRLWERAHPELVAVKAPRDYVLTNAAYHGRVVQKTDGARAVFTATFDILVLNDAWTAVPLPLGSSGLETAMLDGHEAPLTMLNGAPTLVFEKAGRHTLSIEFERPVAGVVEQGSVLVDLPGVEAGVLEIETPVEGLEFRTSDPARPGETTTGGGATSFRVPVDGLRRIEVSWRSTAAARTLGRAIFHSESAVRLFVDERLTIGVMTSTVRLVRGEIEQLVYDVPDGATVLRVAADGLADWRLDAGETARALTLDFTQPVKSQVVVTIELAAAHAGLGTPSAFPDVRLRGAQSEQGTIEFYARRGLDVAITEGTGLEPKLKPSAPQTLAETGISYEPRLARVYPRRPFALTFTARKIPNVWTATAETLYTATEQRLLLEAHYRLVPESGSIYELLVDLPDGFETTAVHAGPNAEWRVADAAANVIAIRLGGERTAAFDVGLVAERLQDAMPAALQLVAPRVTNAARQSGVLAAAFAPAWEILEPQHAAEMQVLRDEETPAWMRTEGRAPIRFAARYWEQTAPEIIFGMRQADTRLSATLVHHLTVLGDEAALRVLVSYSVAGKPVRRLQFTAPAELRYELRVVGMGLRGPGKPTGRTADGRDVWTVEFHSPVEQIASFEVQWRGEVPAGRRLDVPRITAVGAEVETVFVNVENLSVGEVTAAAVEGLAELPIEQVPVVPPSTRLSQMALAYRATQATWRLALSVVAYDVEHLIPARVGWATLETVVDSEGGARTRMTLEVQNRTQQFLRVTFPDEVEFWTLKVGGEPAAPSHVSGNTYLIPLIKSGLTDVPFEIEAIYSHRIGGAKRRPGRRLAWSSGFRLVAPEIEGLPTNNTVWHLYLPSEYRTVGFGGNMEQTDITLVETRKQEWKTAVLDSLLAIAEQTRGERQQQALQSVGRLQREQEEANVRLEREVLSNQAMLRQDEEEVREKFNISAGKFARQQQEASKQLEITAQRIEESKRRAQRIISQNEEMEQAAQQAEGEQRGYRSNVWLGNWDLNGPVIDSINSKELQEAYTYDLGQAKGALAGNGPMLEERGEDAAALQGQLERDAWSNAGVFVGRDGREAQRQFTKDYEEAYGNVTTVTLGTGRRIEELGGQEGYKVHTRRVTTQAVRPGARSLAFELPTDGRLFVFSKLNAEAEIEVKLLRAGTWHGLKTLIALAVLVLIVWGVGRVHLGERIRSWTAVRQVKVVLGGLTLLLLLVVLIGRFAYVLLDVILVAAAVAWGAWWLARRGRPVRRTAGAGATDDEDEDE